MANCFLGQSLLKFPPIIQWLCAFLLGEQLLSSSRPLSTVSVAHCRLAQQYSKLYWGNRRKNNWENQRQTCFHVWNLRLPLHNGAVQRGIAEEEKIRARQKFSSFHPCHWEPRGRFLRDQSVLRDGRVNFDIQNNKTWLLPLKGWGQIQLVLAAGGWGGRFRDPTRCRTEGQHSLRLMQAKSGGFFSPPPCPMLLWTLCVCFSKTV